MKANVSEADHPLLCESTRKQRGELALAMLLHYKDDTSKLSKVTWILCLSDSIFSQTYSINISYKWVF